MPAKGKIDNWDGDHGYWTPMSIFAISFKIYINLANINQNVSNAKANSIWWFPCMHAMLQPTTWWNHVAFQMNAGVYRRKYNISNNPLAHLVIFISLEVVVEPWFVARDVEECLLAQTDRDMAALDMVWEMYLDICFLKNHTIPCIVKTNYFGPAPPLDVEGPHRR